MGWTEYYRPNDMKASFGGQLHAYRKVAENIFPEVLDQNSPLTWVLGGCYPHNGSAQDFMQFCRSTHPHPSDRHILLDMNSYPLAYKGNPDGLKKVQARLEDLPFLAQSIDVLFLDLTLNYLNGEQVRSFVEGVSSVLHPNGLIVATSDNLIFPFLRRLFNLHRIEVPQYYHPLKRLKQLASPHLKIVFNGDFDVNPWRFFSIRVLARAEHPLPEYKDSATSISDNEHFVPQPTLQPAP